MADVRKKNVSQLNIPSQILGDIGTGLKRAVSLYGHKSSHTQGNGCPINILMDVIHLKGK